MAELPALILLGIGAYYAWKFYAGFREGLGSSTPEQRPHVKPQARAVARHWENNGYREVEVVGESNYQAQLTRIVGNPNDDGVDVPCLALLVPEPTNPYDRNAVRVDIDGGTVGYLARQDAVLFKQRLDSHGLSDATTSAPAVVLGGRKIEVGRTQYCVWLEMERL
jgi:hypothetical protein